MSTWFKQGVYGELTAGAAEGLRLVEKAVGGREDIFVTSKCEGTHGDGSLHPSGNAFDMRKLKLFTADEIRRSLGKDYDLVEEATHWHVEYDPK